MSVFPTLKSGAVAQYPAQRAIVRPAWVARFVDGTEQRFRLYASPLHRWTVNLSLLTEREVVAIREFAAALNGRFGTFQFTDPWDETVYANCSLETDSAAIVWAGENDARTRVVIRENRS